MSLQMIRNMRWETVTSEEARLDVLLRAEYIASRFQDRVAAQNFLDLYERQLNALIPFPTAYRCTGFEYNGYEIRIKPFDSCNLFFTVDEENGRVIVLRVLGKRQDWRNTLLVESEYHLPGGPV